MYFHQISFREKRERERESKIERLGRRRRGNYSSWMKLDKEKISTRSQKYSAEFAQLDGDGGAIEAALLLRSSKNIKRELARNKESKMHN